MPLCPGSETTVCIFFRRSFEGRLVLQASGPDRASIHSKAGIFQGIVEDPIRRDSDRVLKATFWKVLFISLVGAHKKRLVYSFMSNGGFG